MQPRRNFICAGGSLAAWTTFSSVNAKLFGQRDAHERIHTFKKHRYTQTHNYKESHVLQAGRRALTFPNGNRIEGGWRSFKSGVTSALNPHGIYYSTASVIFPRWLPCSHLFLRVRTDFRILSRSFDNQPAEYHPAKRRLHSSRDLSDFFSPRSPPSLQFHSLMNFLKNTFLPRDSWIHSYSWKSFVGPRVDVKVEDLLNARYFLVKRFKVWVNEERWL